MILAVREFIPILPMNLLYHYIQIAEEADMEILVVLRELVISREESSDEMILHVHLDE